MKRRNFTPKAKPAPAPAVVDFAEALRKAVHDKKRCYGTASGKHRFDPDVLGGPCLNCGSSNICG